MFFGESRLSDRRTVSRDAKLQLADGSPSRDCVVIDISEGGARLHVKGLEAPDRFVLVISDKAGGARPRNCKVIWRRGCELGVEFLDLPGHRAKQRDLAVAEQPAAG